MIVLYHRFNTNLVSVLINVPVSDTVVLGDGLALWHLLVVLHRVLLLLAVLVGEVLVAHVALLALGRPDLSGAFSPSYGLQNVELLTIIFFQNLYIY